MIYIIYSHNTHTHIHTHTHMICICVGIYECIHILYAYMYISAPFAWRK
jgi:hypothetical protein